MNDLKSELSGNLEDCLLALMEPSVLYDAKCLRRAMRVSSFKAVRTLHSFVGDLTQALKDYKMCLTLLPSSSQND